MTEKKLYKKSLFIFRRDLRLEDNNGLIEALDNSEQVILLFIFDPQQAYPQKNEYFSENAFEFMIASLKELESSANAKKAKLYLAEGTYEKVLPQWIKDNEIEAIFVNKDYTPFARKRDGVIDKICKSNKIEFIRIADYALSMIEDVVTGQGKRYSVFTPFMNAAKKTDVAYPRKNNFNNYYSQKVKSATVSIEKYDIFTNPHIAMQGGRSHALKRMRDDSFVATYGKNRDLPAISGTSKLSPHIKFGTVSIREVYYFAKEAKANSTKFINELYWRDFYMYISYHYPHVFEKSFQRRGNEIKWINNKNHFEKWCQGKTGVPFVDAGMRQLNKTGWMHNRVRMVVASYLTKNLLIDWRWGEKFFAQKLVDYDSSSNNGGWQWSASLGADPKPIRIFNPYTQAQKYDPDAKYIKQWVSELKNIDTALLIDGKDKDFSEYKKNYCSPLVNQKESFHRAMETYRAAKK